MRKGMAVILTFTLIFSCCIPSAMADETFKIGLYPLIFDHIQSLINRHPELNFVSETSPNTTEKLINAFLTGTFDYDVFPLTTSICDLDTIISKGYLAELTEHTGVADTIASMRPDVQAQVMKDGMIYGIPSRMDIEFMSYNPDAFARMGWTEQETPDTFPEFLDMLDDWLDYVEATGATDFCVCADFDESLYQESTYVRWLTELLVKNTIMHQTYAGEALHFDSPVFLACLERCQTIGKRIYEAEGQKSRAVAVPLLVTNYGYMTNFRYYLSLRLDEQQPKLISASMWVEVSAAGSDHVDIAAEFALAHLQYTMQENAATALLFSDPPLVPNPHYESTLSSFQTQIDAIQKKLASATDPAKKTELQDELAMYQRALEEFDSPENVYLISEKDMNLFRSFDGCLYFEAPGVFAIGTEYGQMLSQLLDRYAAGLIPADQFVQRLEEIAWMLQMETA